MIPTSLSASAVQCYESCPARFMAAYVNKAHDLSGTAANLGTVIHASLERYVADGWYQNPDLKKLLELFEHEYYQLFRDSKQYKDGIELLTNWFDRTDLLDGRKILTCEVKEEFQIKTSQGPIPFRYIFDRCDELPSGDVEVVDYKSGRIPLNPEDLKNKIQARVYGLAAAIKYPNREKYWVSFDQLRYDLVGTVFTRDDNIVTWNYLKGVAEKILADDGLKEVLNPECRWCVRRTGCEELLLHAGNLGELGITDFDEAVDKRAQLDYARAAIGRVIDGLDEFILAEAEEQEILEHKTASTELKISVGSRRDVDTERVVKILGADKVATAAKISITWLDDLLKNGNLDDTTKSELRQLIRKRATNPSIRTKPIKMFDEED